MNALFVTLSLCVAQCGPNGCPAPSASNVYHWKVHSNNTEAALFLNGVQIGNWYKAHNSFIPLDLYTRQWGQPVEKPPVALPQGFEQVANKETHGRVDDADGTPNYGIDSAKIPSGHRYWINGKEVSREAAMTAVAQDGLEDDSSKFSLTMIGNQADCDKLRAAIEASDVASLVHLKCYRPDDPMVKKSGFVTHGTPTVYLQTRPGKVLGRTDNAGDPQKIIGAVREAERKRKPNYDPAKDQDLAQSANPLLPANMPPSVIAILAFLALFLLPKVFQKQTNGVPK